jgi:hypothetical protein
MSWNPIGDGDAFRHASGKDAGMSSTLERWYISGPLDLAIDSSALRDKIDAHSGGNAALSSIGSLMRHDGWENLNLLDWRSASINQGANLNWWGKNAGGKAVRLGTISARFSATADGGSSGYLSFYTKGAGSDVSEALRIDGNRNASFLAPNAHSTVIVGSGGNGSLRVRHIDGKGWQGDSYDGLYLNWNTGKGVDVGSQEVNSGLTVHGDITVRKFPPNDTTQSNNRVNLVNRAPGGVEQVWSLFTAAAAGGWGVSPNGFDIWEYPATRARFRIRKGGDTILVPSGGNAGIGTESPQARLHVAGGDLRLDAGRTISANGRLHITGDERLYLLNRAGVFITKDWGGTGDLLVQGRIGVNGQSPNPRTSGWGGGIHTWDIEVEGTGWSRNGWQSGPRDLAENFETLEPLEPGIVVSFDADRNAVIQASTSNDPKVCGVVSTKPGLLLNANADAPQYVDLAPIALAGRVPCRVVDENGPIRRGDLLTSSSSRGHAMRADPVSVDGIPVYRSGTIVGKALDSHDSGTGVIDIFVTPC